MTANEIRAIALPIAGHPNNAISVVQLQFLQEAAAQLAELNEKLARLEKCLVGNGRVCRYPHGRYQHTANSEAMS